MPPHRGGIFLLLCRVEEHGESIIMDPCGCREGSCGTATSRATRACRTMEVPMVVVLKLLTRNPCVIMVLIPNRMMVKKYHCR